MRKRLLLTGLIGLSLVMTACGGRGSLSGKGKESGNSLDSMIASKEAEETKGGSENSIIAVLPDSSRCFHGKTGRIHSNHLRRHRSGGYSQNYGLLQWGANKLHIPILSNKTPNNLF